MANKYYRQNLNKGGGADKDPMNASDMQKERQKRNRKKLIEKFKKAGRPEFSKGGGADSGKMGEMKSKVTLAADRIKKLGNAMGKSTSGLTKKQIEKLKEFLDKNKNKFGPKGNVEKFMKPLRRIENPEAEPMRDRKKQPLKIKKKGSIRGRGPKKLGKIM